MRATAAFHAPAICVAPAIPPMHDCAHVPGNHTSQTVERKNRPDAHRYGFPYFLYARETGTINLFHEWWH